MMIAEVALGILVLVGMLILSQGMREYEADFARLDKRLEMLEDRVELIRNSLVNEGKERIDADRELSQRVDIFEWKLPKGEKEMREPV